MIKDEKDITSATKKIKLTTPHAASGSIVPQKISPTPPRKKEELEHLSSKSLPPLPDHVITGIKNHSLQFRTNAEPCALQLSCTGRILAVAFTDGTVRLFDMTGRYKPTIMQSAGGDIQPKGTHCSYTHQRFGAVAVQLEAKGVHRSLLIQVDVSPDSQWFFAGALRGSMEMAAIYIGDLEAALSRPAESKPGNLLDLIKVYTHSDAKLRGFEACTCFQTASSPQYLLLTGRGIKNCHIWRFVPPSTSRPFPIFEAIMNLPTNGTTVKFLHFREKPFLQVVTKSDDMKIQVWDLREVKAALKDSSDKLLISPLYRPSYQDVPLTESALGVAGSVCLCGGSEHLFNTLSVVTLDDRLSHATELALPGTSTNRRRSRGDLQSVASVATMFNDADHALLQLSDDSLVWFKLSQVHPTLLPMTEPGFVEKTEKRKVQIRRVGYQGTTIAVSATFDSHRGAGKIQFMILEEEKQQGERFWGYLGTPLKLASEQSPAQSVEQENLDMNSFGTMEDDDDDGSNDTGSLKISPKAPSITPSISEFQKQSIVTPQIFELKQESVLEKTESSALRPLARQLTQTMPFVSAKKVKKSTNGNDPSSTVKNADKKRTLAALRDNTEVPRKKKVKAEASMLEDLAAASILKSIGQEQKINPVISAQSSAIPAQISNLTRTESKVSFDQTKGKPEVHFDKQSHCQNSKGRLLAAQRVNFHTAAEAGKKNELSRLPESSMSPPIPRKKASSHVPVTASVKVTVKPRESIDEETLVPIETAASQSLAVLSSKQPAAQKLTTDLKAISEPSVPTPQIAKVQNISVSKHISGTSAPTPPIIKVQNRSESKNTSYTSSPTPTITKKQNVSETKHMTETRVPTPPMTKIQNAAPLIAQTESKQSCKKIKKNYISKRCSAYIEKLQIELDKLGPHKSRLLTAGTPLTDTERIQGERKALMNFATKRAIRMAISVLKSVHLQPTRSTWLEAKSFLDESLKDLNTSWVRYFIIIIICLLFSLQALYEYSDS